MGPRGGHEGWGVSPWPRLSLFPPKSTAATLLTHIHVGDSSWDTNSLEHLNIWCLQDKQVALSQRLGKVPQEGKAVAAPLQAQPLFWEIRICQQQEKIDIDHLPLLWNISLGR